MFIDVHAHLDLLKGLDKIISECKKKKIAVISQGINPETNRRVLSFAKKYENVKAAIGIYPDEVLKLNDKAISDELIFIEKYKGKISAIGEIGLDSTYKNMEKQKEVFEKLVKIAIKTDKPVIIHSRKAELETIDILEKLKCEKVIMHCFSGNKKLVERVIKNKWYLSISSNVKYNLQFQENVKSCPMEQLLCETDSPFLSPDKKFPNTPLKVIESYKKIAEIKKLSLTKVESIIYNNYVELIR